MYSQHLGIHWLKFRNYGFISFQYEHVCLVVQAVTFLAHLAKGNVSFCHHLACRLLTFHILIFSSETTQPNEMKLGRTHLWKVLSKVCSFCLDPSPNKSSPLKPLGQMNRNLIGSIYWWQVLYKDCSFRSNSLTNMAATGYSCFWLVDF